MSCGHSYSNYTEDARKFISLTPIPRKFIPESLFQWNVSLGTEGLSPTLGNKDGYGGKGAQGFSSSQVIKMQIVGVEERPAGRFPRRLVATALTSVRCPHLHVHQVCLLIQSGHWPGEERESEAQWPQGQLTTMWGGVRGYYSESCFLKEACLVLRTHRI